MESNKIKKILVPLDGSKSSLRGLDLAIIFAKFTGSTIIGLNVFSFPSYITISSNEKNKIRKKHEQIIKQAELISQKSNVSFKGITKTSDNTGRMIVNTANIYKANMIIIGSHGPNPELGMFLGSVANFVLNISKIPVTLVK